MRKRFFQSGFSLIEILIAIIVLTIGIMGVLGAISYGLHSTDASEKMTKAIAIERKIMEQAVIDGAFQGSAVKISEPAYVQFNSPPYDFIFSSQAHYTARDYANYTRRVEYSQLTGGELMVAGSNWEIAAPNPRIARIMVTVRYVDRNNSQKSISTFAYDRL